MKMNDFTVIILEFQIKFQPLQMISSGEVLE